MEKTNEALCLLAVRVAEDVKVSIKSAQMHVSERSKVRKRNYLTDCFNSAASLRPYFTF